jgi:5-formyltetrahydrofolate cyclo-ligase
MVESMFHVPEHIRNKIPASPAFVRTVIVPMTAFDQRGNRIGHGAGYCDRFLAGNPIRRRQGSQTPAGKRTALRRIHPISAWTA